MRPTSIPDLAVLAERHPHGVRVRYMTGCRCLLCRAANSRYQTERALAQKNGDWNGIVSANHARRHLRTLSRHGIGRYVVAEAAQMNPRRIAEIVSGKKKNIRARVERQILSVTLDARGDKTLVDATPVWKLIDLLLDEGISRKDLARRLGSRAKVPSLQLNRQIVTAKNAARVERLFTLMMTGSGVGRRRKLHTRPIPQRHVA